MAKFITNLIKDGPLAGQAGKKSRKIEKNRKKSKKIEKNRKKSKKIENRTNPVEPPCLLVWLLYAFGLKQSCLGQWHTPLSRASFPFSFYSFWSPRHYVGGLMFVGLSVSFCFSFGCQELKWFVHVGWWRIWRTDVLECAGASRGSLGWGSVCYKVFGHMGIK